MGSSGLSLKSAPEREPTASMMQAAAAEGRANALENAMKAVNTSRPSSGMPRQCGMHTRNAPTVQRASFCPVGMKDIFSFCFFIMTRMCVVVDTFLGAPFFSSLYRYSVSKYQIL